MEAPYASQTRGDWNVTRRRQLPPSKAVARFTAPACPRDLPNFMENIVEVSAPGTNSRNDDSGDDDPDDQPPPLEPLE